MSTELCAVSLRVMPVFKVARGPSDSTSHPNVARGVFGVEHGSRSSMPGRLECCAVPNTLDRPEMSLALDGEKLDFEDENCVRTDLVAASARAVCKVAWNEQLVLVTDLHHLQSFGPAADDAVHAE